MSTIKDSQLIQLIAMVGLSSFVERAQEAVERIQSVALDKRREHRDALTLARNTQRDGLELHESEQVLY